MRGSVHKKNHPGAAGEVGLDQTASILFQNGFFGKFGRPFAPAGGLTFLGAANIRSTSRWFHDEPGVEKNRA